MSKIQPGFDFDEMRTLLEIAQQTYDGIPPSPGVPSVPDPPSNWQLQTGLTPSQPTLLDNFWQVWKNTDPNAGNQYAIAVRGTVETVPSVLEDLLLPMIPARSKLSLKQCGIDFDLELNLARAEPDSAVVAGVHVGFVLGLLSILFTTDQPLWLTLFELPADAEVYITGHSQGASVATLLTSFVHHSTTLGKLFPDRIYKSYVFAQAQPGNDHYAYDYDVIAGLPGLGFTAVSTQDWVPQVPLTLEGLRAVNTPNPLEPFGSSGATAEAAAAGPVLVQQASEAEAKALASATERYDSRVEALRGALGSATFTVPASKLPPGPGQSAVEGEAGAQVVGASCFDSFFDQLKGLFLPNLNYTAAGQLVPAFATPGANPENPKDFFWQHHLGNYLKFLTQQYDG